MRYVGVISNLSCSLPLPAVCSITNCPGFPWQRDNCCRLTRLEAWTWQRNIQVSLSKKLWNIMISQGRSIVLRPSRSDLSSEVVKSAEQKASERVWEAVCVIFGVTVLALIGFRRYTRYLHQRRYEDHVSAKEKR